MPSARSQGPWEGAVRTTISLNGTWAFKSNADTTWRTLHVPGSYAGYEKFWSPQWKVHDYPARWEGLGAVYEREVYLPTIATGKRYELEVAGALHHSRVYVNGEFVGENKDGYFAAFYNITPHLRPRRNTIKIEISNRPNALFGDFKTHIKGIWKPVRLHVLPTVKVGREVFIKTSVSKQQLRVELPVLNTSNRDVELNLWAYVSDSTGRTVNTLPDRRLRLKAGEEQTLDLSTRWRDARLWWPHDPVLHHLHIELTDAAGKVVDRFSQRFGFREITREGPNLYLNGQRLFLRGHSGHSFADVQGSRAYYETWIRNLQVLGLNFMRLHNDPKHEALYEVADELGFLLEAETVFHFHTPEDTVFAKEHLRNLIVQQRRHPSVILWSVSNELRWRGGGEKPYLIEYAKTLDATRPVFASDFSQESRFGDVIGHHYNPRSVFTDWEKYGPNKPMIWDEVGYVWNHQRSLANGTAGFEVSAQDYATGLYKDGHDEILADLNFVADGRMIDTSLHRVTAYVPWGLSYNFWRWLPTYGNQTKFLDYAPLGDPDDIPLGQLPPHASTVNPWDDYLPEVEPNPGFYLFNQHFGDVRFFDASNRVSFFAGEEVEFQGKLYYEDLRPADRLVFQVGDAAGAVLGETERAGTYVSGLIDSSFQMTLRMPVEVGTDGGPFTLKRIFYRGDEALHQTEQTIYIYPRRERSPQPESSDVVVTDDANELEELMPFVRSGGRVIYLAGGDNRVVYPGNRWGEDFAGLNAEQQEGRPLNTWPTVDKWQAGIEGQDTLPFFRGGVWINQQNVAQFPAATTRQPAYIAVEFADDKSIVAPTKGGKLILDYTLKAPWRSKDERPLRGKEVRVLLQDQDGIWFVSDRVDSLALGRQNRAVFALADLEWYALTTQELSGKEQLRYAATAAQVSFERATGVGLYFTQDGGGDANFFITRMGLEGQTPPSARLPLHGAAHPVLAGLDQRQLSFWNGSSTSGVLDLPVAGVNFANLLQGDRDGRGSALYEEFHGRGLILMTSLNLLEDCEREPVADEIYRRLLAYATDYEAPKQSRRTIALLGTEVAEYYNMVGVATDDWKASATLDQVDVLLLDGSLAGLTSRIGNRFTEVQQWMRNGGTVYASQINEQNLDFFRQLTGTDLALTDPFLGERGHIVKAATSHRIRTTPERMVEYYDGVFIPQPFEPNFDPLLSGLANLDLSWGLDSVFTQGVEVKDMPLLDANTNHNILLSNWRIDWTPAEYGAEYAQLSKDIRRAYWFVNRDAVLLRLKVGEGQLLINQLDLPRGGQAGRRVAAQILTHLGVNLGRGNHFYPATVRYDRSEEEAQRRRFASADNKPLVTRTHYGPSPELEGLVVPEDDRGASVKKTSLFAITDQTLLDLMPYLSDLIADRYQVEQTRFDVGGTADLSSSINQLLNQSNRPEIVFSVGLADVRMENGQPATSLAEFEENLRRTAKVIKRKSSKAFWTSIQPLGDDGYTYDVAVTARYNEAAIRIMDENEIYTNDLADFAARSETPPGESREDRLARIAQWMADGLTFFGAQF